MAALGMGGCGSAPDAAADGEGSVGAESAAPEATGGAVAMRGYVVLGDETRTIKPCDEAAELWIVPVNELREAYEGLTYEPYAPMYAEVEGILGPGPASGAGSEYGRQLRVTELVRAAPATESRGCDEDLSEFAFRAAGVEPFWSLQITPAAIVYSTPDIPRTVFEAAEPAFSAGGWVYEAAAAGPEPLELRVHFEPGRCSDTMVGAIYSWSAVVEIAGDERRGCAWQGALAPGR